MNIGFSHCFITTSEKALTVVGTQLHGVSMDTVEGCSVHKQGKPEHVVVGWTNWQWQVTYFAGSCKLVAGLNKLVGHV